MTGGAGRMTLSKTEEIWHPCRQSVKISLPKKLIQKSTSQVILSFYRIGFEKGDVLRISRLSYLFLENQSCQKTWVSASLKSRLILRDWNLIY